MPNRNYGISYDLRFKDANVRRAYYDHFWQTPRRLATVSACMAVHMLYYAARLGLAQLPEGNADWLRLGLGGRGGAFAAAIFSWSALTCAYFLLVAFLEARRARKGPLLTAVRRPAAGWLNPSGLGVGKQNALMACLFWPVMVLRVLSTVWWPEEVRTLSTGIKFEWLMYEQSSFLLSMTLGYGPICALLGLPAVVVLPQALAIGLVPVITVWFDQHEHSLSEAGALSTAEIGGICSLYLFLGAVTLGITYAIALLPMLIWKTSKVEQALSRQRDLVMVRPSDISTSTYLPSLPPMVCTPHTRRGPSRTTSARLSLRCS